jgi:hypothetical protein
MLSKSFLNIYQDGVFPVNSDPVGCSALYEIRETQNPNHPINQYGNGEPARPAQLPGHTMSQPFHLSSVSSLGINTPAARFMPMSTDSFGLPLENTVSLENSEMDLTPDSNTDQASPATTTSNTRSQSLSHSGGGAASGSHSSYSPSQNTDQIPYRPSPRMTNRTPSQATSTLNNIFYSTSNDMMNANFEYGDTTSGIPPIAGDVDFNMGILGNEWDMGNLSGGTSASTGITPMSEGTWNDMLHNMNMGWDSVGPPHLDFDAQKG